jgi:hypothetical protein
MNLNHTLACLLVSASALTAFGGQEETGAP